jgi:hypothetical protein
MRLASRGALAVAKATRSAEAQTRSAEAHQERQPIHSPTRLGPPPGAVFARPPGEISLESTEIEEIDASGCELNLHLQKHHKGAFLEDNNQSVRFEAQEVDSPLRSLGSPQRAPQAPQMQKASFSSGLQRHTTADLINNMKARDTSLSAMARTTKLETQKASQPWTKSQTFNGAVCTVIVGNAICLGLEADFGHKEPGTFGVLEHVFTGAFALELVTRLLVEGIRSYFVDHGNWLDFILVILSVLGVWVIQPLGMKADLRLVSLMRMVFLARLARLLRLFRIFRELTLIIEGFIGGARALGWAMSFLLIIVYIFAVVARLQIGSRFICPDGETEISEGDACPSESGSGNPQHFFAFNEEIGDQKILFGSISTTMLTLFVCLTEGCGIDVIHPTVRASPTLAVFWILFAFVTTFGVLNLIIGIFCDNMMRVAMTTEKKFKENEEAQRKRKLEDLRTAFTSMDKDGTGYISRDEFHDAIKINPQVMAALLGMGLGEEKDLFDQIDADHSGRLDFNEFFDGATRMMNGMQPALAKDTVATYLRVCALCKAQAKLENEVSELKSGVKSIESKLDRLLSKNGSHDPRHHNLIEEA